MNCKKCGGEILEGQKFCPYCGEKIEAQESVNVDVNDVTEIHTERTTEPTDGRDTGRPAWLVLGLFFPVVGLVLYLVWRRRKPRTAKKLGLGAIIGGAIYVTSYIVYFICVAVGAGVGAALGAWRDMMSFFAPNILL